jgi:hypothetical protein
MRHGNEMPTSEEDHNAGSRRLALLLCRDAAVFGATIAALPLDEDEY